MLPASEIARLDRLVDEAAIISYSVAEDGGMTSVVLHGLKLPPGANVDRVDMLLRLPAGFPDAAPDMFWCDPPVRRADGGNFPNADQMENHLGKQWQRFSRHLAQGEWRAGVDSIDTFLVLIFKSFNQGLGRAA